MMISFVCCGDDTTYQAAKCNDETNCGDDSTFSLALTVRCLDTDNIRHSRREPREYIIGSPSGGEEL